MRNSNYPSGRLCQLLRTTLAGVVLAALALSTPHAARGASLPPAPEGEPGEEYIKVYGDDCATQKLFFAPGDAVCAEAGAFYSLEIWPRRFQWVAPSGHVVDLKDISADPQFDKIILPDTGEFAQSGKWSIRSIGKTSAVKARGSFVVRMPLLPQLDLSINLIAPDLVFPGERLDIELHISNDGPDDGLEIEFASEVPTNMVFVGIRQVSGPEFECATPKPGDTGTITCRAKGMALDETAEFRLYYQVNLEVSEGETCTAATRISSATPDSVGETNNYTTLTTVAGPER